jgi:hypothetical protein
MNWDLKEFLADERKLTPGGFRDKYESNIPHGLTIKSCVDQILRDGLVYLIVDQGQKDGDYKKEDFYLIPCEGGYEVFMTERGFRHGLTVYKTLEEAIAAKLQYYFNEVGYTARDAIYRRKG